MLTHFKNALCLIFTLHTSLISLFLRTCMELFSRHEIRPPPQFLSILHDIAEVCLCDYTQPTIPECCNPIIMLRWLGPPPWHRALHMAFQQEKGDQTGSGTPTNIRPLDTFALFRMSGTCTPSLSSSELGVHIYTGTLPCIQSWVTDCRIFLDFLEAPETGFFNNL